MTDSHSKSKSNHHILIVDDDNEHRRLLGLMLADEGYTISHAINGQQAISLHRSRPCDLVITELTVGGRDSFSNNFGTAPTSDPAQIHRHRPDRLDAAGFLPAHG